jgi:hypothetical protein
MLTVRENVEYEKAESWMCIYYKFKLPELFYWFHIPKMTATKYYWKLALNTIEYPLIHL